MRTYPAIQPVGYDFAPDGERSIVLGNSKAMSHARSLIYVEDQYLWGEEVGEHFATVLRQQPGLRLVIVLPAVPDVDGTLERNAQLSGRLMALERILEAGGDRVAVFSLTNSAGLPVYVHSKVCIIDDRWASVGSDNFNRRSWSSDSEIACTVMDERTDGLGPHDPVPADGFPLRLRRMLCGEHLGIPAEEVPDDPDELFAALTEAADRLDEWYATSAADRARGLRRVAERVRDRRRYLPRARRSARERVAADAAAWQDRAESLGGRPPGQLRALVLPELTDLQRWFAERAYAAMDPDGTLGRDEDLEEQSRPD